MGFHKIGINFLPAEDILAAQEGPCRLEFIIIFIIVKLICFNRYTGYLQVHEINNVFKLYNVATILWLDIAVQAMLFPFIKDL